MIVNVPSSISHMSPHLTEYVELMAAKLMVNAHKDKITGKDIPFLLELMAKEVKELQDQVALDETDLNSLEETADIGNFAFLLYAYLRSRGVQNVTERFINEYYDIRPEEGRVYSKKSRSGSALKPGDEVKGTVRRGRVYIRAQHAITGAAISLPRAHLIWWKAKGDWPQGTLRYISSYDHEQEVRLHRDLTYVHPHTLDCIGNLTLEAPKLNGRLPFVSQYQPKGREGSPNFGKWVYQRRHAFRLVRCGYYDTQEEAAIKGLRDWKDKTRRAC